MSRLAERDTGTGDTQPGRGASGFLRSLGPVGLLPLAVLFGLNMVDEFDRVAFGALAPEIRDAFNLSDQAFVTVVSLSGALSILLSVPIGYLADRSNRVRLTQAGALVWGVAAVVTGLAPFLAILIVSRFVSGVGRLVNEPVHPSLLSDYYPSQQLPRVFGIHRFANNLGNIAGPIAGALTAVLGSWRPAFVIMAVPTLVLFAASLVLSEPQRGATMEGPVDSERVPFGEAFRRLRAIQTLRRTWVAAFFFGSGVIPFASFLSLFFEDIYAVGPIGRGFLQALFGAGGAVGLFFGTRLARRAFAEGRAELLPVVIGLMILQFGVGIALMALVPWLPASAVMSVVLAVGASGFLPAYLTMVALVSPPRLRSQAYSYSLLFFAIGGVVLSRMAAGVGDDHGLRVGLLMLSVFVALGGAVEFSARRFVLRDMEQASTSVTAQALAESGTLLVCRGVDVAYDQVQVVFGADFDVHEGEIVALLGPNGAGKSTLLAAISGLVDPVGGAIFFDGRDITHADANQTALLGIAQVPGGRGIFPGLSVADNIRVAGWTYRGDPAYRTEATERVLEYFPILRERWDTLAGSLSGGEQQMLSLAQAFIAKPKLLLIDELSLGLAPTIIERLLDIVRAIHDAGTTVVLVEQSVNTALRLAQRAVFMEKGEIRFAGSIAELLDTPEILRAVYLRSGSEARDEDRDERRAALAAEASRGIERPVVLEARSLMKRYGGITAVDDVSFELYDGEVLGLIGPNGAGKTTIFDLLSGFTALDGGRIFLHSREATGWSAPARSRAGLGRSFQDSRLWPSLTVREAIAASLERHVSVPFAIPIALRLPAVEQSEAEVTRRADEVVALFGLAAFADKFVSELSTGSRRLVEIAALVAQGPSIVILDEPSSGLAQKETEQLGPLLREVRSMMSCSMLVIEHHMPLISWLADRMIALDTGRIIATGAPDEVLNHPRVVESYLGSTDVAGIGVKPKSLPKKTARRRPAAKPRTGARGKA